MTDIKNKSQTSVLLCERINEANQYVEMLANAYQSFGIDVVFDVQNFLYSNFLPDFVHIQWPESIYRWRHKIPENDEGINFVVDRLSRFKRFNIPIVYTAHNNFPHENVTEFDKRIYNLIIKFSDVIVHHGKASIGMISKEVKDEKKRINIICPHGPYPFIEKDSEKARKIYNIPSSRFSYLNFGRQRQNKGGDFIRNVFKKYNCKTACLFTIGPKKHRNRIFSKYLKIPVSVTSSLERSYFRTSAFFQGKKRTFYRTVVQDEIPFIISACDVMVLGHQEGLNSGLLALAASYGKPVVFPDIGNFCEQVEDWPWHECYQVGNIQSAVNALQRMEEKLKGLAPGVVKFDNSKWLVSNSWEKHINRISEAVNRFRGQ